MTTTDWLILSTAVVGPACGALFAPGFIRAVLALATARAQRVKHVPVSGADLYHRGVPLDEAVDLGLVAHDGRLAQYRPTDGRFQVVKFGIAEVSESLTSCRHGLVGSSARPSPR